MQSDPQTPAASGSAPQAPSQARIPRDLVVAALIALAVCGAIFGPTLSTLGNAFLGIEYVDHYGTQWFYWFAQHTLETGTSPGHTDLFFYPWGKDIYGHTGANVLDAYLAVPFRVIFGPILGYNLFFLTGVAVSGLALAGFAREVTDDRGAILVGATLFALSPFVLFEASEGRPTQAILLFPVLFLWAMWRSATGPGLRAPIAAGVMLALCGYQYWYYAFFGGMLALAHGLWRTAWPVPESGGRARVFARHALIAIVAVIITLPVAGPLFMANSAEVVGRFDATKWSLYANPPVTLEDVRVGILSWQPLRHTVGSLVEDPDGTERFLVRITLVPYVVYAVLAWWIWRPGRLERGPVLAMLAAGVTLAAGPVFLLEHWTLPNPLYIGLVKVLPFMQRLWWPARAFAFVDVLIGLVLVACLAEVKRRRGARAQGIVAAVIAVGWVVELGMMSLAPFPQWSGRIPAGYKCLASGPPGALIEVPYGWTQAHLYFQTTHGRPLLGGMIENNPVFTPEESEELRTRNTYVKGLLDLTKMQTASPVFTAEDKEAVRALGYRYVVLEKDAFGGGHHADGTAIDNVQRTRMRRMRWKLEEMAGALVYDDERIAIYSPWGDPAPCDVAANGKDTARLGRTEATTEELYHQDPGDKTLWRLLRRSEPTTSDTDAPTVAEPR